MRRCRRDLRVRPDRHADLRGCRAVRPRHGRGHRHRRERDLHLRGPRRRPANAASRGHSPGVPGLPAARHAQPSPARASLLLRPLLPVRPPPGRTLPAAPPVRGRGHRRVGRVYRRRGDRARLQRAGVGGDRRRHAGDQLHRRSGVPAAVHRPAARLLPVTLRRADARRLHAPPRHQPAAAAGLQEQRMPAADRAGARLRRQPVRRLRVPLGGRVGTPGRARHHVRDGEPAGQRPRLLHPHGVRGRAAGRRPAELAGRRGPIRRDDRGARRAPDARHRLRPGHRARAGVHPGQPARCRKRADQGRGRSGGRRDEAGRGS